MKNLKKGDRVILKEREAVVTSCFDYPSYYVEVMLIGYDSPNNIVVSPAEILKIIKPNKK